jgi:hypothetical protein
MEKERPKSILKKEVSKKHVKFDRMDVVGSGDARDSRKSLPPKKQQQSGKFSTGKSNIIRDSLLLVGIIGFLLYYTLDFTPPMTEEKVEQPIKQIAVANTLNNIANSFVGLLQTKDRRPSLSPDCSTLIGQGSIPGTGYSLYAGRNYNKGDLVVSEAQSLLPVGNTTTSLPAHAFLIKPHPYLANVEGVLLSLRDEASNLDRFSLRATRPIHAGEEFFVTYTHHPASSLLQNSHIFDQIPSVEDYALADGLIDDLILTSKRMVYAHLKRMITVNTDYIFTLMRRSIGKLNPAVAALLPSRAQLAKDRFGQSSSLTQLKNKTLQVHQLISSCLDDLQVQEKADTSRALQVTRNIKKGEVVTTVPMYVISDVEAASVSCETTKKEECASPRNPYSPLCLFVGSQSSPNIFFCPLTEAIYLSNSNADTATPANVEFQWADSDYRKASILELINAPVGVVAWNVVALKNLEAGVEVRSHWCMELVPIHVFSLTLSLVAVARKWKAANAGGSLNQPMTLQVELTSAWCVHLNLHSSMTLDRLLVTVHLVSTNFSILATRSDALGLFFGSNSYACMAMSARASSVVPGFRNSSGIAGWIPFSIERCASFALQFSHGKTCPVKIPK